MRTVYSGLVDESFIGQTVTLFGWAHRRRDHGGVIFIDLRDREGIVQVVCDPDRPEVFATADKCRNEFCLRVVGVVRARPEGTKNETLVSGGIEVLCHELEILNPSVTPPFHLDDENLSETTRLTYRVLDLRRGVMQKNLRTRYRAAMAFRKFLDKNGFIDIETPMLTRSTPEGARDYLVPSRVQDGCFFALPQSPQLFKQLLMVAGFDRYYQIVKCFRDEDLRADRQPEFTQVDIETSFLNMDEIRGLMEKLVRTVFKEAIDVDLVDPFPVMLYDDAMAMYGSDKPDLRISLRLHEVTDIVANSAFKVFSGVKSLHNGKVVAICVPGAASMPRSEIDTYTEFVKIYGAKGLAYIKVNELARGREGLQSPIVKNLSDEELKAILERVGAKDGDVVFFGADKATSSVVKGKGNVVEGDGTTGQFYFTDSGNNAGRGYSGVEDGFLYYMGKLQKADSGTKYEVIEVNDKNYLVTTSGKVVKSSTVKDANGTKFKTSSAGVVTEVDGTSDDGGDEARTPVEPTYWED